MKHYGRVEDYISIIEDQVCFLLKQDSPPQRGVYTYELRQKRLADLVSLPTVTRCLAYQYGGGVMGIGIGGIG